MMPENNNTMRRKIKTAFIIAAAVIACGYMASIGMFERKLEAKRLPPEYLVSFTGLPDDPKLQATIQIGNKTSAVPFTDGKLILTEEQKKGFTLPYRLKVTFQTADEKYHDFIWDIDSQGVEYYITVDGFSSNDHILLALDGDTSLDIPFDWSGRIVLPIMLIIAKDTKSCIEIWNKKNLLGACHMITGKKTA